MFLYVYRTPHHMRAAATKFPVNTNSEAKAHLSDRIMWFMQVNLFMYLRYKLFKHRIKDENNT